MKINIRDYDNILFGSDLHLFHDKEFIWKPRGFNSKEEHTEAIINGINEQATENSLIILLGDFCLTCTYEQMLEVIDKIKCKHILTLIGNHDHRVETLLNKLDVYRFTGEYEDPPDLSKLEDSFYYNDKINSLGQFKEITIHEPSEIKNQKDIKTHITLCHFPLSIWNHQSHGSWHLCGHSHGSFNETCPCFPFSKRLDVGVDNAKKYLNKILFTFDDIKDIMSCKLVDIKDHHDIT